MCTGPFYLYKTVLNVSCKQMSPGFSRGSAVFIHTISHDVKYMYFHVIVETGEDSEVQVRGQKTFMNGNKCFRSSAVNSVTYLKPAVNEE